MTGWHEVHQRAAELADGRDAVRLANIALVAASMRQRKADASALRDGVETLVTAGPILCDGNLFGWQALADEAHAASRSLRRAGGHDQWVMAFQAVDPARKSRGAYATPRELADPMARLLLRQGRSTRRILDPSAGAGALLLAVMRMMAGRRPSISGLVASVRRLYGVELDPVAHELCCLQLWMAARGAEPLASITARIRCDNAITRDWFQEPKFDGLIMNPPWESLRGSGGADSAERAGTLSRLDQTAPSDPSLPSLFSCQGRGDRNLYKAFVELAPHLVRDGGTVVALLPGAWSSDLGTKQLRELYLAHMAISQWTSFENRRNYFPIDGRYKFGVLVAQRASSGTRRLRLLGMAADAAAIRSRHVSLAVDALRDIGGPALVIPDLVDSDEARLLRQMRSNGIGFFERHPQLGRVTYERELDLTEDRKNGRFERIEDVDVQPVSPCVWRTEPGGPRRPLIEGRMIGQYDFFEKSWLAGAGRTAVWRYNNGARLEQCQPQFVAPPVVERRNRIAICDVTSATNTRTVLASWVPSDWPCGNTAPVLIFEREKAALAALAILNSVVFDWQARRMVSGLHLNRFYLQAMSWPRFTRSQLELLAERALNLLNHNRRFQELAPARLRRRTNVLDYRAAHVDIEATVAVGFHLSTEDVETVYRDDRDERRGFWRWYASDPHASEIARATCERVAAAGGASIVEDAA